MTASRRDWPAYAALLAATLLLGAPILAGRTLYYGDITLQFIPWRAFARQTLLNGTLPLWTDGIYLGMPLLANLQSAVLYPFHWLTLPLPPAVTIAVGYLTHVYLAAAGTLAFVRLLGGGRAAGVVAGLTYGLGGFVLSKQQFPSLAYTLAWLPWLLWSAERLWRAPGARQALPLALVVALQWLAGHTQIALMQLALAGAWLLAGRPRASMRAWSWGFGALALGTLLALGQLLPTLELVTWSDRTGYRLADVARFNLPPWQLATLLAPGLFGAPHAPLPYLGVGAAWETLVYPGIVALALALAGLRRRPFWGAVAAVGLLVALGSYTPLYGWLFDLLPPLRLFRDPARFALWFAFAVAMLAAEGVDEAAAGRAAGALAALALLGSLAAALLPTARVEGLLRAVLAASPTKAAPELGPLAQAWSSSMAGELMLAALLAGAAALAMRLRPGARRGSLTALVALDLLVHLSAVNPTVPAGVFAASPLPPERRAPALVYVPEESIVDVTLSAFNFAQAPRPPRVAAVRAALLPDVTLPTPVRQVGGYDPLRPRAIGDWLVALGRLPEPERRARLASLGVAAEVRQGRWIPLEGAANVVRVGEGTGVARVYTPQRRAVRTDAARVAWTFHALPGWRAVGGRRIEGISPPVSAWAMEPGAAWLRLRYEPSAVRVGLFGSLSGLLLLTALGVAVTQPLRPPNDPLSRGPEPVVRTL